MGRTGKWFAYQHPEIVPDVLTCAKALAGGIAAGVMMARPRGRRVARAGDARRHFRRQPDRLPGRERRDRDHRSPTACSSAAAEIGARFQEPLRKPPRRVAGPDPGDPHPGRHDRLRPAVRRLGRRRGMPETQAPDQRHPRPRRPAAAGLDDHRRSRSTRDAQSSRMCYVQQQYASRGQPDEYCCILLPTESRPAYEITHSSCDRTMPRHFVDLWELSPDDACRLIAHSLELKHDDQQGKRPR